MSHFFFIVYFGQKTKRQFIQNDNFCLTTGAFADTIFEVAGVQATIDTMTKLVHTRSKVVIVAAHQKPITLDVRALYMKECDMLTSRTCTTADMDDALKVIASNSHYALGIYSALVVDGNPEGSEL